MPNSPAPPESPVKGAEAEAAPDTLSSFKALTRRLLAVDRTEFEKAVKKDNTARRAKRGR